MYVDAAKILKDHLNVISNNTSLWVQSNYPEKTAEFEKYSQDISHIVEALITCLINHNTQHIDFISRSFFKNRIIQLKSLDVELKTYDVLLLEIKKIVPNTESQSIEYIEQLIERLKRHLQYGFNIKYADRQTKVKHLFYSWNNEMEMVKKMQKCQRNWDYSRVIDQEEIDYMLWHAENAPSKQHEGYYDVYWTADRAVIEEMSKYTWGSTHSRNPPSTWRNTQANANLYILFVAKEPETQLNCHSDGSLKSNKEPARWENAYVSIGIAMGLVMRAAHSLGLSTGCNKSHGDINGNNFWENRLGILDDVAAGRKKIAYGVGIGYPQDSRPRWETDDYELCIGAANGSSLTTLSEDDPEWMETHPVTGRKFRKVKIVDIRTVDSAIDPYGNIHEIPQESSIKINTMRKRVINITEIK